MKAVIYARYSSAEQREESIEGQLRECQEYAERHNLTIINTYIDRALSAKSDNRPAFQDMIRDSAKNNSTSPATALIQLHTGQSSSAMA